MITQTNNWFVLHKHEERDRVPVWGSGKQGGWRCGGVVVVWRWCGGAVADACFISLINGSRPLTGEAYYSEATYVIKNDKKK